MIDGFDEVEAPEVKAFLESVYKGEQREGILSISPVHGYPMANIPDMGSKMLVISDGSAELAHKTAEEFGLAYFETRGRFPQWGCIDGSLDDAQTLVAKGESVNLCELSDSAGGGFTTDCMELIHAMLQRGMTNCAVGMIWDPLAVSICQDVGAGAEITLRIGGKACVASGNPLDLDVVVECTFKDVVITNWQDEEIPCDAAVVRCGERELCMVSKRVLPIGLQAFRDLGVEPSDKSYLVAKYIAGLHGAGDAQEGRHFLPVFGSIINYKNWSVDRITRSKWPWDENPFDEE